MRSIDELHEKQALPLSMKIKLTEERIREWVNEYGEDGVYVSFSGGKDSTVLLDIARRIYPNMKAVFFDTGLEYPEIRQFVKSFDNVDWLKPKKTFKEVIDRFGYPFISKEVAICVYEARKHYARLIEEGFADTHTHTHTHTHTPARHDIPNYHSYEKLTGTGQYSKRDKEDGAPVDPSMPDRSRFAQVKWEFLLDAPFEIGNQCCRVMKKDLSHRYTRETGRNPISAQMASESLLRRQQWLQSGCNAFNKSNPISNPMSFWFEQDVLLYIKKYEIPICSALTSFYL